VRVNCFQGLGIRQTKKGKTEAKTVLINIIRLYLSRHCQFHELTEVLEKEGGSEI